MFFFGIRFMAILLTSGLLFGCFQQEIPDCSDERTIRLIQNTAAKHLKLKEIIVKPHTIKITEIQTLTQTGCRCLCSAKLAIYKSQRFPITYSGKLRKKRGEFHIEVHGLP